MSIRVGTLDQRARTTPVDEPALSSLKALERDSPGFLSELVREFDEGIRGRLGDMQLAAGENDGAGLCGAAHSVKGSAGIVGARGMASLCQHLERLAADGQATGADALIASLAHEHEAVLSVLREAVESGLGRLRLPVELDHTTRGAPRTG